MKLNAHRVLHYYLPEDVDRMLGEARALAPPAAMLTNPHTGEPRDYRDVESDPAGVLIVEPGAPLRAVPSAAAVRDTVDAIAHALDEWLGPLSAEDTDRACDAIHRVLAERAQAVKP